MINIGQTELEKLFIDNQWYTKGELMQRYPFSRASFNRSLARLILKMEVVRFRSISNKNLVLYSKLLKNEKENVYAWIKEKCF